MYRLTSMDIHKDHMNPRLTQPQISSPVAPLLRFPSQSPSVSCPSPYSQFRGPESSSTTTTVGPPGSVPKTSDCSGVAPLKLQKGKTYQPLRQTTNVDVKPSSHNSREKGNTQAVTSSRRHASMPHCRPDATALGAETTASVPDPDPPARSLNQAQLDIANDRHARAQGQSRLLPNPGSPPIVDFTRFEDTYRGPRSGNFEGLVPGTKTRQRSVSGGCYRPNGSGSAAFIMNDRYPAFSPSKAGGGTGPLPPASTPAGMTVSATRGLAPAPASTRKPDPRGVLSALKGMLGDGYRIDDYLQSHELLGMHQLDELDFDKRDCARATFMKTGKLHVQRGEKGVISVLGEPIRTAAVYASVPVVLSGREHEIPIIVVNTVEELYRTGIYQANLFRRLPNRGRLMELINIYDSEEQAPGSVIRSRHPSSASASVTANCRSRGDTKVVHPGFGAMTSLHLESTPDVCALLTTYISSLREPILCRFLFRAIWDWCGVADELETEEHGHPRGSGYSASSFAPRLSSIPLARTYTSPEDATRIATALLLLHLLPSPHFSLLVYLLAFFSQVALVREENGVGVADLARMYGARIFGGETAPRNGANHSHAHGHSRDGETMMLWFLRRWGPLSDGLFDVLDDASMGLFRRTQARRDSFGKDILSSSASVNGASPSHVDTEDGDSVPADGDSVVGMGRVDTELQPKCVLDSRTTTRDRSLGQTRMTSDTPVATASRAGDYPSEGYCKTNGAQSGRSKLLRAYSISDQSLNDFGMSIGNNADDFVSPPSRHRADDVVNANPRVQHEQHKEPGSRERPDRRPLDVSMSAPIRSPPHEHECADSSQRRAGSIPQVIIKSATPPTNISPQQPHSISAGLERPSHELDTTDAAMTESQLSPIVKTPRLSHDSNTDSMNTAGEPLDVISKLREENTTLHNSVWRLEAELAQLRRERYAPTTANSEAAASAGGNVWICHPETESVGHCSQNGDVSVQDAEAVKIVAEIRKLMAKN